MFCHKLTDCNLGANLRYSAFTNFSMPGEQKAHFFGKDYSKCSFKSSKIKIDM